MTKRIFVAASLLATVCVAHADVLPASTTSSQSTFLDHWTDAKGNDIASSNVLGSNVRLVGGVALGNESAAQALLQKASADAANGAAVTIKRTDGITGTYALASSNYKAAAAAGDGVSVVTNSNGDLVITKARTGGGGAGGNGAGGGAGGSGGGSAPGGSGAAPGQTGSTPGQSGSAPGGGTSNNGAANGGNGTAVLPAAGSTGDLGSVGDPLPGTGAGAGGAAAPSGEVPEPSTIALMMVGMAGAMSMLRRRAR